MGASHLVKMKRTLTDELPTGSDPNSQPSLPMNREIGEGLGHVARPHLFLRSELALEAIV